MQQVDSTACRTSTLISTPYHVYTLQRTRKMAIIEQASAFHHIRIPKLAFINKFMSAKKLFIALNDGLVTP
jgi:hypothetical protein